VEKLQYSTLIKDIDSESWFWDDNHSRNYVLGSGGHKNLVRRVQW
jgi:hypothetical protein